MKESDAYATKLRSADGVPISRDGADMPLRLGNNLAPSVSISVRCSRIHGQDGSIYELPRNLSMLQSRGGICLLRSIGIGSFQPRQLRRDTDQRGFAFANSNSDQTNFVCAKHFVADVIVFGKFLTDAVPFYSHIVGDATNHCAAGDSEHGLRTALARDIRARNLTSYAHTADPSTMPSVWRPNV